MRTRFLLVGAVSALLMPGTAIASESAAHESAAHHSGATESGLAVYRVTMQLHDGAELVASPVLDVKVGEMATVSIADGKGHRYSVRLMPVRVGGGNVFVASSIDVASGSETYLASPVQMAPLGEAAAIELDKGSPSSRPFRLDFTLTAPAVAAATIRAY